MGYKYSKDGPTHGQWDNSNDEKAAHGGLRHTMLKGTADKTAPPVGNSAAQYREKPSDWQNGPIALPTADVISLVKNDFKEIREDIEEFTRLALECEPFSEEKTHFQYLLATICKASDSDEIRQEALRRLLKTSCWGEIFSSVPGYQEVINESFSN